MKKTLKFLSWMLVMLLAVTFTTSCSDDDDNTPEPTPAPTPTNALVGSWQGDYTNGKHYVMTFYDDGTGVERDEDASENFKYSYTGNLLIIDYNRSQSISYTVSITGKTLMLIKSDGIYYTLTRL